MRDKWKKYRIHIVLAVFISLLLIHFYPAVTNGYPKGSDSWYHLYRAENLLEGSLEDKLNAGGIEWRKVGNRSVTR